MSNQIQATGAVKIRSLTGALTASTGVVSSVPLGGANGVATLDSNGKVPVTQLPSSVMEYKGTWNASTNTPTLANGTGDPGDVYICNVAGTANFGAGPITFAVGDWVVYNGSIWQKSGGATGTVTSVAVTETGDALTVTGSPITTFGTINIGFAGTSAQYVRGDGSLQNFPSSGGGGGAVSYYLNGSVNQGTFGGNTYYEMNKVPVIGAGTNFTINANGYIAQFITDVNDPSLLEIPGGNWNFEMHFSASSGGGTPSFYVELYKYNGTTFTLIASNSTAPEGITNGTANDLYTTSLAVPTTSLTITDRLAVRVYVIHSGRTITLYTEDSNLCQVITTFSTGITALNGLTAQVQYFGTGTSGTDFNISSATASHTFNLPIASTSNTGKLSSTDWTTFNAKVNGTGTLNYIPKITGTGTSITLGNSLIYDYGTGVVIGDTTSSFFFDVNGTARFRSNVTIGNSTISQPGLIIAAGSANQSIQFFNAAGGVSGGGYGVLTVSGTTTSVNYKFSTWNSSNAFYIQDDGNIGIGTPVPNYKLDVSGTGRFTGSLTGTNANFNYVSFNNSAIAAPTITGFSSLTFIANSPFLNMNIRRANGQSSMLRFPDDGFTHQYDLPTIDGTLALTSQITGTTNYLSKFTSTGLVNSLIWDNGTNVGIGNTNTTFKLDVSGTGRFTGQLTLGSTITNGTYTYTLPSATGTLLLGSGTTNYIPKFTSGGAIGNSSITDDGSYIVAKTANFSIYQSSGVGPAFQMAATSTEAQMSSYSSSYGNGVLHFFGGQIDFWTGTIGGLSTSQKMLINSSGNVSIGNTNDTYKLDVTGTGRFTGGLTGTTATFTAGTFNPSFIAIGNSNGNGQIQLSSSANYKIGAGTDYGGMAITVGGSDRIYILNNGNVGIGISSPNYTLDVQYSGNISQRIRNNAAGGTATLLLETANTFSGTSQAYIQCIGTAGGGQSQLVFATAGASGDSSATERMRITSGGNVCIGTTTVNDKLTIDGGIRSIGSSSGYFWNDRSNASNFYGWYAISNVVYFFNGSVNAASITPSTGVYTPLSDINKKKDFEDSTIGLNAILGLKPTLYRMKSEQDTEKHLGFIAQEVKEFIPQAYVQNEDFIGLNYNAIVAALVKSVQELKAEIDELKNK